MFYPKDEKFHAWLVMLLESYSIIDHGISSSIDSETTENRHLACQRGCAARCRTHKSTSVTPVELKGISWYATEKVDSPIRE